MRAVVFGALCVLTASVHGGDMTNETKTVLALQCFLNPEQEQRIVDIWKGVLEIEGVQCAHSLGAVPHITAGSWRVTPEELEQARTSLVERVADMPAVEVDMVLEEQSEGGVLDYCFRPTNATALVAFHANVHKALGYPYETFRPIDVPGQWWPHLTLFSVPEQRRAQVREAFEELSKITHVRVERLGLVTFGPIKVLAEARLARDHGDSAESTSGRAVHETEEDVKALERAKSTEEGTGAGEQR